MGPARTGKGIGAYQFDRVFPGVGRIKKSSGTDKLKKFQDRDALLTKLYESSALEVLRAFKAGKVTIEELIEADRGNNPAMSMQRLATTAKLGKAITDTLPKMGSATATRNRYQRSLDKLLVESPALAHARVGDLVTVDWSLLSGRWPGGAADWNNMVRALSRFLTVYLGDKYHPIRRQVMAKLPKKAETPRTPDQSVELFLRIVATMPAPAQPCFMVLALTGMRIGEYIWADRSSLRPETRSVVIDGKTGPGVVYLTPEGYAIAEAAIPCPLAPAPTPGQETHKIRRYGMMRRLYRKAQQDAGVSGLRLHDIRHLFGQTAADENVPTVQTQAQMRHTDPKMTRRYEMPAQARQAAEAVARRLGIVKPTPKKRRA
jgi:xanthosine utilization system XapX-like protein